MIVNVSNLQWAYSKLDFVDEFKIKIFKVEKLIEVKIG